MTPEIPSYTYTFNRLLLITHAHFWPEVYLSHKSFAVFLYLAAEENLEKSAYSKQNIFISQKLYSG